MTAFWDIATGQRSSAFYVSFSLFCCALLAYLISPLIFWDIARITAQGWLVDDTFFYSLIADRLLDGQGMTFDGRESTNGVQPLWQAMIVIGKWAFPSVASGDIVLILSWVTFLIGGAVLIRFAYGYGRHAAMIVALCLLANPFFHRLVLQGLETPLVLIFLPLTLMLTQYWLELQGQGREGKGREGEGRSGIIVALVLGAVSAALFLTRTDLFWFPVIIAAVMAMRRRWSDAVVFCCCLAVLVLPYLAYNHVSQGSVMPISGRVKLFYLAAYFPTLQSYIFSDEWSGIFAAVAKLIGLEYAFKLAGIGSKFAILAVVPLVTILFALGALAAYREYRRKGVTSFVVFTAGIVLHAAYMHFFYRELRMYTAYYFVPELIWMAAVVGRYWAASLERAGTADDIPMSEGRRRLLVKVVLGCSMAAIALAGIHIRTAPPAAFWTARLAVAEAISREIERTPEVARRIGAFWPGALAYFSMAPIAPLDGIISSQSYFENYVKTGRQLDYALEHGIDNLLVLLMPAEVEAIRSARVPTHLVWSKDYIRLLARSGMDIEFIGAWPASSDEAQAASWYWLKLGPQLGPQLGQRG
jgi:hypothetical protein